MSKEINISFVSPVYLGEKILNKLVEEIENVSFKLNVSYEIILVDDRSPDKSWEKMISLSNSNNKITAVRLSRNFGQHPAIMAGLSLCKGEWIVVLDCDLQDHPAEVEKLYKKAVEGYDVVFAKRKMRKDNFIKKSMSYFFSRVYGYLTDTKFDNSTANFGIYHSKVIDEILKMNDFIKSFPLFIKWVGFNSTAIEVEHFSRFEGKSTYTWSKLFKLAFDTIISFSNKPLKLFVKFGMFISFISVLFGLYTLYKYFSGEIKVIGYSSLIVSIWFLSGVIITTIGIVGIYIGKIFDQTKNRSSFIIDSIKKNGI